MYHDFLEVYLCYSMFRISLSYMDYILYFAGPANHRRTWGYFYLLTAVTNPVMRVGILFFGLYVLKYFFNPLL